MRVQSKLLQHTPVVGAHASHQLAETRTIDYISPLTLSEVSEERRKEMFYLTTHSTHFIYGYMVSDIIMVKDHSGSERENLLPPHGLLFPISSKGSFICTIPQDNMYHEFFFSQDPSKING